MAYLCWVCNAIDPSNVMIPPGIQFARPKINSVMMMVEHFSLLQCSIGTQSSMVPKHGVCMKSIEISLHCQRLMPQGNTDRRQRTTTTHCGQIWGVKGPVLCHIGRKGGIIPHVNWPNVAADEHWYQWDADVCRWWWDITDFSLLCLFRSIRT